MLEGNLLQILQESRYTTVLSGFGMLIESGYPSLRDGEKSYDIEQKYGYSMEEMFSSSFYSTRKVQFFTSRRGRDFLQWRNWRGEDCSSRSLPGGSLDCPERPDVRM